MLIATAYAQAEGAAPAGGGLMGLLIPLVLVMVIFYFLMIRPQQKQAKQHREMLEALEAGDRIVTNGGLHGRIMKAQDDVLTVEIALAIDVGGRYNRCHGSQNLSG